MEYKLTARSIHELGQRSNQEDSIFPVLSAKPSEGSLYILCDGMGGHAAGEVASQTVCETMSRYIADHPREDGYFEESDFYDALNAAYDALDAKDTGDEKKMGTTLTFVKFHAGGCFIAHIGDSRIYQIRPSEHRLMHVTRDHSLVNDLIKLGEMTPEEAKTSRQKNVITRAVQPNQERRAKADCVNLTDLKVGDYFYMCSDGMLEQAEDEEIVNILSLSRPDADKIEILRGATKDNKDNHSAHLIRIVDIREKKVTRTPVPEPVSEPVSKPASEPEPVPASAPETAPASSKRIPKAGLWTLIPALVAVAAAVAVFVFIDRRDKNVPSVGDPVENVPDHIPGPNPDPVPASATVPPVTMGSLRITSEPAGASIWLDGKDLNAKTPVTLENVERGKHAVKLVLKGFETFDGQVDVFPNKQSNVARTLNPVQSKEQADTPKQDGKLSGEGSKLDKEGKGGDKDGSEGTVKDDIKDGAKDDVAGNAGNADKPTGTVEKKDTLVVQKESLKEV